MMTRFWNPGVRCFVQRSSHRTVVDVTWDGCPSGVRHVAVVWQPVSVRGLADAPPVTVAQADVGLVRIPGEGVSEARTVLPAFSDAVWNQCYVVITDACENQPPAENSPDASCPGNLPP